MKVLKQIKESLIFALNTLKVNRLRTVLTLLGITIGIFAIISVFTVFDSLEIALRDSFASLGDDVIYVDKMPWAPEPGEEYKWWEYLQRPLPTLEEYEIINKYSQHTLAACFSAFGSRTIKFLNKTAEDVTIWGASHEFEKVRSFEIREGRYFSTFESAAGKPVAIMGIEIADALFPGINPIGRQIKVSGRKVTVIGLFKKEGKDMLGGGGSLDQMLVLPVQYTRKFINIKSMGANPMIMVKARSSSSIQELTDELRSLLRARRGIKPREKDNFALNQSSLITNSIEQVFGVVNMVGWIIGGFSILVGGFGIANIMFVSVKERTRIIGIQKSLGAKRYVILWQFLFEAIMLSMVGGGIGLLIIFIGSLIANASMEFQIILTIGNIFLGLLISGIIGIIAGYAPARSAARMNPVDAINTAF